MKILREILISSCTLRIQTPPELNWGWRTYISPTLPQNVTIPSQKRHRSINPHDYALLSPFLSHSNRKTIPIYYSMSEYIFINFRSLYTNLGRDVKKPLKISQNLLKISLVSTLPCHRILKATRLLIVAYNFGHLHWWDSRHFHTLLLLIFPRHSTNPIRR